MTTEIASGAQISAVGQLNTQLRTVRTDSDIAADLKRRIADAYSPVLVILDEAVSLGFIVQVNVGEGPFGKQAILQAQVLKKF